MALALSLAKKYRFNTPPPPKKKARQICDTVRLHGFTRLIYSFNMGISSLPFPNSLVSRVHSLPPFNFSSSGRYDVFLCNEESKNSIEDWLNLTFYRTLLCFTGKETRVKNRFSLFWKRVIDELSSIGVSAVFQ